MVCKLNKTTTKLVKIAWKTFNSRNDIDSEFSGIISGTNRLNVTKIIYTSQKAICMLHFDR